MAEATRRGFAVVSVATEHHAPNVELVMDVQGRGPCRSSALAAPTGSPETDALEISSSGYLGVTNAL